MSPPPRPGTCSKIDGQPVGYQATTLTRHQGDTETFFDGRAESHLVLKRFGQVTSEQMEVASRESGEGDVVRVEARISSQGSQQRTIGRRVGNRLQFETQGAGAPRQWSVELPGRCGGFFAVEWSLRRKPMAAGENRQLSVLMPVVNQVATCQLDALDWSEHATSFGPEALLEIHQLMTLSSGQIDGTIWMNRDGEIVRSEIPSIRQVTFRTDQATALAAAATPSTFDLGNFATIPVTHPIQDAHTTQRVRYRIHVPDEVSVDVFTTTEGQAVKVADDGNTADVTVSALRPTTPGTGASTPPPATSVTSSALIQSDDSEVMRHAQQVRPAGDDPWDLAVAIERYVYESVREKNFSTALASAATVARNLSGDCTEHAVLTAAICRARQLPARVLIGLVYVESEQAFVFHMWNEVWIDGHWIPIDATLGNGGTGAAHLILARSDLSTGDAFSAFLPVINVLGRLEIEVVDVEHQP